jgi:glycosyltransferase involved in cell wall biosynthesis
MNIEKIKYILFHYDVIIIYSDAFINLMQVLKLNVEFKKRIIIFPVGFTGMRSSSALKETMLKNLTHINFVCHDENYVDAIFLRENNIPYSIIPNGVSEKEFKFTPKNISNGDIKNIICVANTFPKKGHVELLQVCDILLEKLKFNLHIFCHTPSWDVGKRLQNQLCQFSKTKKYPVYFHIDKDRSELIKGLESSDLFLFCSLKEVAPLCIIESAASGLPWVSFNVGNVSSISGGIVNKDCSYDHAGYVIPEQNLLHNHVKVILELLNDDKKYSQLSEEGVDFAKKITWSNIAKQYAKIIQD